MLVVETIGRIRREHLSKGKSIKEIARDLKISRNTVRKIYACAKADVHGIGIQTGEYAFRTLALHISFASARVEYDMVRIFLGQRNHLFH